MDKLTSFFTASRPFLILSGMPVAEVAAEKKISTTSGISIVLSGLIGFFLIFIRLSSGAIESLF